MVTKKPTRKPKIVAPEPVVIKPNKSLPTAVFGLIMIILTNYQSEVKQALALLLKTVT